MKLIAVKMKMLLPRGKKWPAQKTAAFWVDCVVLALDN